MTLADKLLKRSRSVIRLIAIITSLAIFIYATYLNYDLVKNGDECYCWFTWTMESILACLAIGVFFSINREWVKQQECEHKNTDREFVILNREFCKDCNKTTDQLRLSTYEFLNLLGGESPTLSQSGNLEDEKE